MRADNNGEGGVLALAHRAPVNRRAKTAIGIAALLGLALFFGDGMLTPAVSVLSAMEGLNAGSGAFAFMALPLTLIILVGLSCRNVMATKCFLLDAPRYLPYLSPFGGTLPKRARHSARTSANLNREMRSISAAITWVELSGLNCFGALRMPRRRSVRARYLVEKDVATRHSG